ncbi:hypothetical protein BGZ97_001823 [Linnemannia gamsii]|uniref:Uncharacterized protein n=1 Tax=Linnemannia gamsii TaxID=64522 RepID=A0A9P6UHT8_9FUNG|nr:hypothetical protein BGZ97_001823 [Linnemannia gamsii]
MFLWFLTLAGLSVEPIADSIFSSRIPMYEGIKIIFAGWLLLAHFDISRPASKPRQNYTIPEDNRLSHRVPSETQHQHGHPTTFSRHSSYISATERIPTTPGRSLKPDGDNGDSTMPRATNLDFGRFKRDLERRRSHSRTHSHATEDAIPAIPSRTNSRLGHVEPSPLGPTSHSREEFNYTPKSASVPRAASLQRGPGSTTSTPTQTTTHQVTPVLDPSATYSGKRSPLGIFLFGSEKPSLKRPSSAMSEDRPSPSLTRNASNLSSRSQARPSALHRTPSGQRSGGEHRVRINAESPGGKNKRQRHSPDDKDKFPDQEDDGRRHTRQSKDSQGSSTHNKIGSKYTNPPTSTSISTLLPNATTSTKFSRPKPPRKSRSESQPKATGVAAPKDQRLQHQSLPESTNQDLFSPSATETAEDPQVTSASFESRMKNVRAWIKGRNPSMISPTLTATSEATATHPQLKRRSSSFMRQQQDEKPRSTDKSGGGLDELPKITKRKAARQLAPAANTKRWAAEDDLERPSQWTMAEDDRIQRQNTNEGGGRSRRNGGDGNGREAATRIYPDMTRVAVPSSTDRQRPRDYSFSQPMPVTTRRGSATRTSDERSRPSSLPTNVDWDRFQKLIGTAPKRSSSSSTLLGSTGPASSAFHRKNSIATLANHHHQDDNSPAVAPLIKLRQSQLRQHQHEDFFGAKGRNSGGGSGDSIRNKFDSTLDLWEQEDDETLARNAAREAEEVEARSQLRLSQARRDDSPSSPSLLSGSPPEDERAVFTFSSPSRISRTLLATDPGYEMAAPTPSLLRTIPFNGESSRRPVPDFQLKKSTTTTQETVKSSPARRVSQSGQDNTNPFLEKGNGSGGRSAPPPPRFNFNFAGAASLAKKRAQAQFRRGANASPEEVAARRERHPGLYTPSKKKSTSSTAAPVGPAGNSTEQGGSALWKESQLSRPSSSPFKHPPSTPTTMSRYIELSSLSDDNE